MKRFLTATAAALTVLCLSAQPKLTWTDTTHDFGAFQEDMGAVSCTFTAVNTGTEPVVVLNARANCGCTRPTYPKTPIAPGDTLAIGVSYDPTGRPGKFMKQIKIDTNCGSQHLLIKGSVIGAPATLSARYPIDAGSARISNSMTPFGQTLKGHVLAAAVNIYNSGTDSIRPAVDSLPPYINALFRPEVIAPGEHGTLSLTAYTSRCPDYGVVTDRFIIIPDPQNAPDKRTPIATTVIVNEDFSQLTEKQRANAPVVTLSDQALDFGKIQAGGADVSRTVTISNSGKSPLLIRRMFTADPALDIKLKSTRIAPGKKTEATVIADARKLRADMPLNARITLITNDPSSSSMIIRVAGQVIP